MNKAIQTKLLNTVRRNYEEIADHFNETRKKYLWPELIKLTEQIKDNDRILDVGCGNGRLLEALKGKNIEYAGIDSSKSLIKIARSKYGLKNQEFLIGNILELGEFNKINFDYVFCVAVLHHLPGQDLRIKALRQLKNKAKNKGIIILIVWNLWSQKKYRKLIYRFCLLKLIGKNKMDFGDILFDWKNSQGEILGQRYYHAFCKRELKKIIKKSGLKTKKIYKDKFNYYIILTKK